LLVDGQLVDPGRTFPSFDPATGEQIGDAPDATVTHAEAAIEAARRAFDSTDWATNVELRVRSLRQLHAALVAHRDEFAALTIAECGHTVNLVNGPGLDDPVALLSYFADLAERFSFTEDMGEVEARGAMHHRWIEREPAGSWPRPWRTTSRCSCRWPSWLPPSPPVAPSF
jgi:acyl-CoA reductase-like NAD-dependent aldehyde dehydrogenase